MFSLLRKMRILNLPIDMQIELFNKLIKPILLYGCEIWDFGNLDIIERVALKFLKLILNLKTKKKKKKKSIPPYRRLPVISYPVHFVPRSFRTYFGYFVPTFWSFRTQ